MLFFCTLGAEAVEINGLGRASLTNVTGCLRFPVEDGSYGDSSVNFNCV